MKKLVLTWYNDPGHGWLRVDRSFLKEFNLENAISHYSYEKDHYVYLEEDKDAQLFCIAAKAHGYELETSDQHTNRNSFIRSLPSYKDLMKEV